MGKLTKAAAADYEHLPNFERKHFPAFVKSFDEEKGIVEHLVAISGNVDEGGDRIVFGAFTKSIAERGQRVKVLDQHSTDSVTRIVGKPLQLREVSRAELPSEVLDFAPDATGGLLATTQYAIDTTRGRDVFNLVKGGFAPESSIGYDATEKSNDRERGPDGKERIVRNLKQVRLWEYSNVIFGMNPATAVVSAKAKDEPTEAKPYGVIPEGDEYCVYKLDADGKPTGKPLGKHPTEGEARTQMRALYANEEEDKSDGEPGEDKAGRVLSDRNAKRIKAAMAELHNCLMEAGLMEMPADESDKPTGPQKSDVAPTSESASEAGPNEDTRTRYLKLIEIEQQKLELLEV